MEKYTVKITKTHYSYGYNAKHRHYKVENPYFVAIVNHIAHKGYDAIQMTRKDNTNDSFCAMNAFFKDFYAGKLEQYFGVKEGESVTVELENTY